LQAIIALDVKSGKRNWIFVEQKRLQKIQVNRVKFGKN